MKEKNSARFFRALQDAPWYGDFLAPVTEELLQLPEEARILDVGCGPGKLMEEVLKGGMYRFTGADINREMLKEARSRPLLRDVVLIPLEKGAPLPFKEGEFDAVVFCSLLFLLEEPLFLLGEALRLLPSGGKIFILTPSGKRRPLLPGAALLRPANASFWLWRKVTGGRGRKWASASVVEKLAGEQGLRYAKTDVFQGMAVMEILEK